MAKKLKTPKPLPSVLTVASTSASSTAKSRPRPAAVPSRADPPASAPSAPAKRTARVASKAPARSKRTPAPTAPKAAPAPAQNPSATPVKALRDTVEVTFSLVKPEAHRVWLGGTFNQWSTGSTPLEQSGDGRWETRLALPPGRHEYKFYVDGQWLADPNAQQQAHNEFGTLNSVVEVRG